MLVGLFKYVYIQFVFTFSIIICSIHCHLINVIINIVLLLLPNSHITTNISFFLLQRTEEQKIIYSGQLLEDNTILKDVLRTYESQIAHTMHLVCTPSRKMPEPQPEPNTDGLRQRNVDTEQRPVETARPETRQNDQNHTVEMQNYLSSFVNNYGRVPPYPNYNMGEFISSVWT